MVSWKGRMEALLKRICIESPVTNQDRDTFSTIRHLQRYHSGLETFLLPEYVGNRQEASLPHPYTIKEWKGPLPENDRIHSIVLQDESGVLTEGRAFVKTVHLLDPIGVLHGEYASPPHALLPQGNSSWKKTLLKLHNQHNQACVDAVASYVIGLFRHAGLTPHGVLSYGSMSGIADSYSYCITDEYESYRNCRWFWSGLKATAASLRVKKDNVDILADPEYASLVKEHFTCPPFFNRETSDDEELLPPSEAHELEEDDKGSLHSFDFDVLATSEQEDSKSDEDATSDEDAGSSDSGSSDSTQMDIHVTLSNLPVLLICQEAQEGTMDELMEEEELNGHARDTPEWNSLWKAWTFQVIVQLAFLQKQISFTHNDLHTNNIVWRTTKDAYLYYKMADGSQYRVPTYGRIFSLIDFGRAIFKVKGELLISDDHWPEHDAGDQYNFGPFYDATKPKVSPNMSFDLCRLAISMLEGLFLDKPDRKKGSTVILSQEGDWKVYETVSPLYNLLWTWTLDDDGQTVYEDEEGEEKFPGFDLYIQIAHTVHDAVPRDQIRKPLFEEYRLKKGVTPDSPPYLVGC